MERGSEHDKEWAGGDGLFPDIELGAVSPRSAEPGAIGTAAIGTAHPLVYDEAQEQEL